MNVLKTTSGLALAIAAASLMGCSAQADSMKMSSAAAETVHCYGVNKCAGHNDCKTANNACKGHGSCKGKGFVVMSEHACKNVGGTVGS